MIRYTDEESYLAIDWNFEKSLPSTRLSIIKELHCLELITDDPAFSTITWHGPAVSFP